ncbi:MAG TPA: pyruvate, phosphate dikinase [Rhizomicrobium sp.]
MPTIVAFDEPSTLTQQARLTLLGGKGNSLFELSALCGLPVPPGFTLTTALCREYLHRGWTDEMADGVRLALEKLELKTRTHFGGQQQPLLLSVRSGAAASMPGMMDTVLNVGLNDATERCLADSSRDASFASDCRRRLNDTFAKAIGRKGDAPNDPWKQLREAIEAVFRSWNSERARAYRRIESISEDLGTAVTVQQMVFGNLNDRSATGVVFSRNPSTGESRIFGDVLFRAQGDDVVSGVATALDITSMEKAFPDLHHQLVSYLAKIERLYKDMVEVEFTIEDGLLWILQARIGKRTPTAAVRIAADLAKDPDFPLSRREAEYRVRPVAKKVRTSLRIGSEKALGKGLGASPGVVTAKLLTDPELAVAAASEGLAVILARPETSPSDIEGIAAAKGILTARGGLGSHAAVVARGWGKVAVVGLEAMIVTPEGISIDGHFIRAGDRISIDGESGEVFEGDVAVREELSDEMSSLIDWLESDEDERPSEGSRTKIDDDALVTLLAIKGLTSRTALSEILGVDPNDLAKRLAAISEYVDVSKPIFVKPTGEAIDRAGAAIAAHRVLLTRGRAEDLLLEFRSLNTAVKKLITDWQLESTCETHTSGGRGNDPDHAVVGRVLKLHEAVSAWIRGIQPPQVVAIYLSRLGAAVEKMTGGDQRFLASPRVDSYHSVWFELHEYLIRLAGSSREKEEGAAHES